MTLRRRPFLLTAVVILVAASAIAAIASMRSGSNETAAETPTAETTPTAIPVTAHALAELMLHPRHSVPATVLSLNDSRLGAEIAARIESIPVQVGEAVSRHQILVELDCRDYRLRLEAAAAQLSLADSQLQRAERLGREHNLSQELLNQRQTERRLAKVAHDEAQIAVSRCTVRAPFAGVVLERIANVGELAAPGTPLLRLLDRGRLEVSAQIPIERIDALQTARELRLVTSNGEWPLRLRAITPAVHSQARNREARFLFADDDSLPGATGRVVWDSPLPHIPADVLVRRNGGLGIFVIDDGHARFHALPDALEGQPAAAIGLAPATRIVVEGRHSLNDGDAIR
ncbi:MAG: efflux RND transporter periplasmic adaptor subunit [Chromatiales bacterium]|jgi:RND family efflux transporter MFP subunit|nr:efflux RND transporter periplasmic adaptor subunit [Chromatiales bacterium]MDX9766178.1 efflux RND transporter periplasmic adaptor subunit [Ectothiorhodospiraceae bacterium]